MATYAGFNIKINNVTIPNSCIKPGSYSNTPEKRIRSERKDAQGIMHYKYYPTLKHKITFTIKAGTKAEYDSIKAAFATRNAVTVRYWDEDAENYVTGDFEMTAPTWRHSYEDSTTFYYAETQIELIEN